jgi:hypothetical protein
MYSMMFEIFRMVVIDPFKTLYIAEKLKFEKFKKLNDKLITINQLPKAWTDLCGSEMWVDYTFI